MKQLRFEQIEPGNENHRLEALSLWIPYIKEIYVDDPEEMSKKDEELEKELQARIEIQGQQYGMHFELVYSECNELVGFTFYAVDHGGIEGMLEAGYGYIMEYYICPKHRRKGYAASVFLHVQTMLVRDGVKRLYLTPDSKTGVPFWTAMGFYETGLIDPDNHMPIYIKDCIL